MKLSSFRRISPVLAAGAALIALAIAPASASAFSVGAEYNGGLVNSDRTPALQADVLDKMAIQGVQVVRANFGWNEIAVNCAGRSVAELGNPDNGCYNWAVLDSLVNLANQRGIKVLLSTSRVPTWVQPQSDPSQPYDMGASQAQFNKTVATYAAFLKAAGTRYKAGSQYGSIPYWTVWNEPNSNTFFKPAPNAARYAQLYAAAAVALKTANPGALVAPGPTGPKSTIKPGTFIPAFQANVVKFLPRANPKRYINAWAHNPYPQLGKAPTAKDGLKFPSITMSNIGDLLTTLDKKPITKGLPVWGTEFGYETKPEETRAGLSVSYAQQAQYLAEGFHKLDATKRFTIGIWYGLVDNKINNAQDMIGDWQSGTITAAGTTKPSFWMFQRMISAPTGMVRKGMTVPVWGRSNVSPNTGQLVYRTSAAGKWYLVPGAKKRTDGTITASFKVKTTVVQFAIYDGVRTARTAGSGYGMYRQIVGR